MKMMERRGGHNRKITPEQREELLRVYLLQGQSAAVELAKQYGVGPDYARHLAGERGYRPKYVPTGSLRFRKAELAS